MVERDIYAYPSKLWIEWKAVWNRQLLALYTSLVRSYLKIHISLNFWATAIFKTVLECLFWMLSHGYNFNAVNCRFRWYYLSEINNFFISNILQQGFWILMSPLILKIQTRTVKMELAIHKMNAAGLHFIEDFQKYLNT